MMELNSHMMSVNFITGREQGNAPDEIETAPSGVNGMRNRSGTPVMRRLLEAPRYEILPTRTITAEVVQHVPLGRTLTVTASVSRGLAATLAVAEDLQARGYRMVPHLAARMITDRVELTDIVARLRQAGVDSVFVPAGDATPAVGAYTSSLELLRDLSAMGVPFRHVGVAGYPESHPSIHDDLTIQAMWDKRDHATHIVSNLCFDPGVLSAWVRRVRARGLEMPLLIGMAGQVEATKLMTMATRIGIGESSRFLAKNKRILTRIASPGGYRPERFIARIAPTIAPAAARVEGLHIFTFNQVAATEKWRRECHERMDAGLVSP